MSTIKLPDFVILFKNLPPEQYPGTDEVTGQENRQDHNHRPHLHHQLSRPHIGADLDGNRPEKIHGKYSRTCCCHTYRQAEPESQLPENQAVDTSILHPQLPQDAEPVRVTGTIQKLLQC